MFFIDELRGHQGLAARHTRADEKARNLESFMNGDPVISKHENLFIYAVGSIGRGEVGSKSDLDIFSVSSPDGFSRLDEICVFSSLIRINELMGFPDFSGDGKFLKVFNYNKHAPIMGSPQDDHENWFTARMLLLLESKPIFNHKLYNSVVEDVASTYFRDSSGKNGNFKPIFVLNDILRFWRTLCLNYETIRNDKAWPWRKKNINLKYSRRLTVFSTVLYILSSKSFGKDDLVFMAKLTPLERLATALDNISDMSLCDEYKKILDYYEGFLQLKEDEQIEERLIHDKGLAKKIEHDGIFFRQFIYKLLGHSSFDQELKEFLIV